MQVDCLTRELEAARHETDEWRRRHASVAQDAQRLGQEKALLERLLAAVEGAAAGQSAQVCPGTGEQPPVARVPERPLTPEPGMPLAVRELGRAEPATVARTTPTKSSQLRRGPPETAEQPTPIQLAQNASARSVPCSRDANAVAAPTLDPQFVTGSATPAHRRGAEFTEEQGCFCAVDQLQRAAARELSLTPEPSAAPSQAARTPPEKSSPHDGGRADELGVGLTGSAPGGGTPTLSLSQWLRSERPLAAGRGRSPSPTASDCSSASPRSRRSRSGAPPHAAAAGPGRDAEAAHAAVCGQAQAASPGGSPGAFLAADSEDAVGCRGAGHNPWALRSGVGPLCRARVLGR